MSRRVSADRQGELQGAIGAVKGITMALAADPDDRAVRLLHLRRRAGALCRRALPIVGGSDGGGAGGDRNGSKSAASILKSGWHFATFRPWEAVMAQSVKLADDIMALVRREGRSSQPLRCRPADTLDQDRPSHRTLPATSTMRGLPPRSKPGSIRRSWAKKKRPPGSTSSPPRWRSHRRPRLRFSKSARCWAKASVSMRAAILVYQKGDAVE